MDIQEEAGRRYPALQREVGELTYPRSALRGFSRAAFEEGAEWARKEALREAADLAVKAYVGVVNTSGMSYEDAAAWEEADRIASAIRALAEVDGDAEQTIADLVERQAQPNGLEGVL